MDIIETQELRALAQRIAASGVLGRSKTYAAILDYLVECSIAGETPKEAAIAVDVLGREADFDVAKDSIVRVHIYHLRSKLEQYYARQGKHEKYRLEIPKGQYILTARLNEDETEGAADAASVEGGRPPRRPLTPMLAGLAILLLLLNLWIALDEPAPANPHAGVTGQSPWRAVFDDDVPVLFVIGDYFIFGELGQGGNVERMVREFDINSPEDLDTLFMIDPDAAERYYNLGLTYIPTGIAPALMDVMPLFFDQGRRVSVKMMSALNASDLTANHVVYLGYVSGLDLLADLVFGGSGLAVGNTYDELRDKASGELYVSDSGILNTGGQYRDYGLLSTFPSPRGHQVIIIAGTRDAGLSNIAQQVSVAGSLAALLEGVEERMAEGGGGSAGAAWEVLFEVYGFDHTNFDARMVYAGGLETVRIWSGRSGF